MASFFNLGEITDSNGKTLHFDRAQIEEGDTVQILCNLILQGSQELDTKHVTKVSIKCPHLRQILLEAELVEGASYQIEFGDNTSSTQLCVTDVSKFIEEIQHYNSFPDPTAPRIEIYVGDDKYFGQVSTVVDLGGNQKVVPHGYGKIYRSAEGRTYDGLWFYGHEEGKGESVFSNSVFKGRHCETGIYEGTEESLLDSYTYTGTFYDWVKHGKGREVFPDGSVAEGEYVDDEFVRGVIYWADGTIESGSFVTDGDGDYILVKGTKTNPFGISIDIDTEDKM